VAYIDPSPPPPKDYPYKEPRYVPVDDDGYWVLDDKIGTFTDGQRLEALHLLADEPPVTITSLKYRGTGFFWDADRKHTIAFTRAEAKTPEPPPGYTTGLPHYVRNPGYEPLTTATKLDGFPPTKTNVSGTTSDATGNVYNPVDDRWYLDSSSGLRLKKRGESGSTLIQSGSLEGKPSWSSNGRHVAYVRNNGSNDTVMVKEIMEGSPLTPKATFDTRYQFSGPNVSNAQLAPTAKWVFFLQDGKLFRAVNASGASRVDISEQLGKTLETYVVAP
jgi:hypothetical protein